MLNRTPTKTTYGAGKSSDSDFDSSDDEPLSKFAGKKTSNRDVDQVGKLPRGWLKGSAHPKLDTYGDNNMLSKVRLHQKSVCGEHGTEEGIVCKKTRARRSCLN